MFSKQNSRTARDGAKDAKADAPSVVSANTHLTGDILSQGEVHIDGRLDGNVRCTTLVVSETGVVNGEVEAESCDIFGTVSGQVRSRTVAIAKTARMTGDIFHETLSVEQGAYVNGLCRRMDEVAAAQGKGEADGEKVVTMPQQRVQSGSEA